MKYFVLIASMILILLLKGVNSIENPNSEKITELLNQMTLEEKVGQMTNIGLTALCKGPFWSDADSLELDTAKLNKLLLKHHVGSVQSKGKYPPEREEWGRIIKTIQDYVSRNSRLGIPVLFGIDGVHGANYTASSTLFPHQIACAATWDPYYAEMMGEVTAYELRASSIPWNYAPVLDVSWQPLWGRIFETFGEDTYLATQMGNAFISGSQGNDISDNKKVAVCMKHFIGYGNPYNGKDRATAIIPEKDLTRYYLPPFEEAIKAGAKTIMLNSGSVNGIPGHVDHHMITTVLKGQLGFDGFVLSDWDDVTKLVDAHNVAANSKEAVKMMVLAGMDMCMGPYDESFAVHLIELVKEGEVPMERINDAVRRILKVKFDLGLFDNPYSDIANYPLFGSTQFSEISNKAAKESLTLLKNQNDILPLSKDLKVLVTGPTSNSINFLNGAWSRTWSGVETEYNDTGKLTVTNAFIEELGKENVFWAQGSGVDEEVDINHAVDLAKSCDVIIVCLGEAPATEKPSDINELDLPDAQISLVQELAKTDKPIVMVLIQGRPRVISEIEMLSDAILMAYLPGQEGGRAIADVILGECNPSGRLPYTYPRYSGSIWKYNYKEADVMHTDFTLNGFNPQYEFGYGLSYTDFDYSEPVISSDTISMGDSIKVSVELTNTGELYGKEVVQLYYSDLVASISPDIKNLVRFTKIGLQPGEKEIITFKISTDDLAFVGKDNKWITEPGDFQLQIGGSPTNMKTINFYVKK